MKRNENAQNIQEKFLQSGNFPEIITNSTINSTLLDDFLKSDISEDESNIVRTFKENILRQVNEESSEGRDSSILVLGVKSGVRKDKFYLTRVLKKEINNKIVLIDGSERIYMNWTDFKNNNILPKGIIIIPGDIIFNEVQLEVYQTPSTKRDGNNQKILRFFILIFICPCAVLAKSKAYSILIIFKLIYDFIKYIIDWKDHRQPIRFIEFKSWSLWFHVIEAIILSAAVLYDWIWKEK